MKTLVALMIGVTLIGGCKETKKIEALLLPLAPAPALAAKPYSAAAPPTHIETLPVGIPPLALAHRNNFIRIWRFYFAYAESPTLGFAQVHQESRWNPTAQSKFASGLAQFTPPTASDYAKLVPAEVRANCPSASGCPLDPTWALNALTLYDYRLMKTFASVAATPRDRWGFSLASYNGGMGWINRERAVCTSPCNPARYFGHVESRCGQSTPGRSVDSCKENRAYPAIILDRWQPVYAKWLGL